LWHSFAEDGLGRESVGEKGLSLDEDDVDDHHQMPPAAVRGDPFNHEESIVSGRCDEMVGGESLVIVCGKGIDDDGSDDNDEDDDDEGWYCFCLLRLGACLYA